MMRSSLRLRLLLLGQALPPSGLAMPRSGRPGDQKRSAWSVPTPCPLRAAAPAQARTSRRNGVTELVLIGGVGDPLGNALG